MQIALSGFNSDQMSYFLEDYLGKKVQINGVLCAYVLKLFLVITISGDVTKIVLFLCFQF